MGNLTGGDFHTQISSGHHDPVCCLDDLINVLHAFSIFYLGDDPDIGCIVFRKDLADLPDHLGIADERGRDKIKLLVDTKYDVFFILLGNTRKLQLNIGDIHTFSLAQFPSV